MRDLLRPGILVLLLLAPSAADGGMIVRRTREDGANALRVGRQTLTFDEFRDLREDRPRWFAEHFPRFHAAMAIGKDALLDRRALNPLRFDHYHPCLGWLLADPFTDDPDLSGFPIPGPPPPPTIPPGTVTPPGDPTDPDPPPGPGVDPPPTSVAVPEPAGWVLAGPALLAALAAARRSRRRRPALP